MKQIKRAGHETSFKLSKCAASFNLMKIAIGSLIKSKVAVSIVVTSVFDGSLLVMSTNLALPLRADEEDSFSSITLEKKYETGIELYMDRLVNKQVSC